MVKYGNKRAVRSHLASKKHIRTVKINRLTKERKAGNKVTVSVKRYTKTLPSQTLYEKHYGKNTKKGKSVMSIKSKVV